VAPWKGEIMGEWKTHFLKKAAVIDFPIHRPYHDLNSEEKDTLWKGKKDLLGFNDFFNHL
jgi:excinuclease ABC subunit A